MESFEQKAYDSFGEVVINKNLINSAGFSARAIPTYVGEWILYNFLEDGELTEDSRDKVASFVNKYLPQKGFKKENIEAKRKELSTDDDSYMALFKEYCSSVTKLSQASLTGYVVHRKAVLDILEKALESDENDSYSRESRIHSIICPMQITSDDVQFEEMNLWIVDDRLSYHRYLASDKQIKSLPMVKSEVTRRMDISVFDTPISYAPDTEDINSVTIIELKRPMRDNLQADGNDPIKQVLGYVNDIKSGSVKKASGRPFGNVSNAAFYCYVIADLTETMEADAKYAGLTKTPDGEGYFGYNPSVGAYIEVISYTKLVKDAKKRNQVLFDKLFEPKSTNLTALVGG